MEHRWSSEIRPQRIRNQVGPDRWVTRNRQVCSCGYATPWCATHDRTKRWAHNHAFEGQLSIELG